MFWKNEKKNIPDKNHSVNLKECIDRKVELELSEARKEVERRREAEKAKRIAEGPDWIEVEGYKAVKFDMTSFHGTEEYHIGETKKCDSHISPCEKGYHFGKSLKDVVTNFRPIFGTRYFKVKGLVRAYNYIDGDNNLRTCPKTCGYMMYEKDLMLYQKGFHPADYFYGVPERSDSNYRDHEWKYVSKEITFIEEVPFEEIAAISSPFNSVIETKEEYYSITNLKDLHELACKKWEKATKGVFSDGFSLYVFEKAITKALKKEKPRYRPTTIIQIYNSYTKALIAVKDEQISQDMRVVLFLQLVEEM